MLSRSHNSGPGNETEAEDSKLLCPICVDMNRGNWCGNGLLVKEATHGSGDWKACYEHYRVISSLVSLALSGKMDISIESLQERQRIREATLAATEGYDENCGCHRCLIDSGRGVWCVVVCNECGKSACVRAYDHRVECMNSPKKA